VNVITLMHTAADLLSEDRENPEYDRAIVELTGTMIGAGNDEREHVEAILRGLKDRQ